jgi:hypothetical protein
VRGSRSWKEKRRAASSFSRFRLDEAATTKERTNRRLLLPSCVPLLRAVAVLAIVPISSAAKTPLTSLVLPRFLFVPLPQSKRFPHFPVKLQPTT